MQIMKNIFETKYNMHHAVLTKNKTRANSGSDISEVVINVAEYNTMPQTLTTHRQRTSVGCSEAATCAGSPCVGITSSAANCDSTRHEFQIREMRRKGNLRLEY